MTEHDIDLKMNTWDDEQKENAQSNSPADSVLSDVDDAEKSGEDSALNTELDSVTWTDCQTKMLILEVKKYEFLYDPASKEHKDKHKRDATFMMIAKKFGGKTGRYCLLNY